MRRFWLLFFLASIILPQNSSAESDSSSVADSIWNKPKYGVAAFYGLNFHASKFDAFKGLNACCFGDMNGSAPGFSISGLCEIPLFDDFYFRGEISLTAFDGNLVSSDTATVLIFDGSDFVPVRGKFESRLKAALYYAEIKPFFSWNAFENFNLFAGAGLGIPIKTSFDYLEAIVEPRDRGYFPGTNRSRTRAEQSGEIETSSLNLTLNFGFDYQLRVNKDSSLFLRPSAEFSYAANSFLPDDSWRAFSSRFGASLLYMEPPPPPPPPPPPLNPPTPKYPPPPKPPEIKIALAIAKVDSSLKIHKNVKIKIEDFVSRYTSPLLNYIFFDENSATIPPRYKLLTPEETYKFNLSSLKKLDVTQTYYNILNIVGYRLRTNPKGSVVLVGTNANVGPEKRNYKLSRARALAVKRYLTEVWKIKPSRLKLEVRALPKRPSNSFDSLGQEENRRVEILSDNWKIIEPIVAVDTTRYVPKIAIRFYPKVEAKAGVKSWKIEVKKEGKTVKNFQGEGAPPDSIDWKLTPEEMASVQKGGEFVCLFQAEDRMNSFAIAPEKTIKIERLTIEKKKAEKVADKEFEYYSLILFDYAKYKLGKRNKAILDIVKKRIKPNSKVVIYGHTDLMGSEKRNKKIAESRAKAVAKYLGIKNAEIVPVGEDQILYDNSLPEGRFYCRTVRITIETPIKLK